MESIFSLATDNMAELECLFGGDFVPYLKTAGTVLLGWIIVSWIWHVILMLFAPAAVSALAIFLICPTTLDWICKLLGPNVVNSISCVLEKLGL